MSRPISLETRRELTTAIAELYRAAQRPSKKAILDEFLGGWMVAISSGYPADGENRMKQSMNGVSVPTSREYDFSDDKLQDSIDLDLPKIVGFLPGKKWEVKNQAKSVDQMSLPEIL